MSDIRTMTGEARLIKEYDKLTNDPDINNCFGVDYWDPDAPNPDVFHWQITLIPPIGTDYEGGFYKIEALFPSNYPSSPPQMRFITKIFHCNVGLDSGDICLNTIKSNWKSTFTMEEVLNHIMILLYKQNPGSPMNGDAAKLIEKEDKKEFLETVNYYKKTFANINDYENLSKQGIRPLKS